MRLITWSFVVIVVLVSSARGAETYVSRDWGFQVDFPAPPQTQEMELNTEFGRAKFARFKAKGADVRAALSVIRYAREAITRQEALVLLKKSLDHQLRTSKGQLVRERDIALNDHPGKEAIIAVEIDSKTAYYRQQIFFVGSRKFLLSVIATTEAQVLAPAATHYLDSFLAW